MAYETFRAKAPTIMSRLMADFPISVEDAAAIVGNLGHESAGFATLQEISPTVKGSRGGYGWAQWTGPRRKAYEAYCKRTGKDPASDDANYAYLFLELKGIEGTEGAAIGKTVAAKGLDAKVEAFELAFLRAGVKHYDSRKAYARQAMSAWQAAPVVVYGGGGGGAAPIPVDALPEAPRGINVLGIIVVLIALAVIGWVAKAVFF